MENIAMKEKPPKQITREELARHEQALERCCPHLWASAARADSQQAWSRAYDQLAALETYLRQLSVVPAAEAVADLKDIASIRAANAGGKVRTAA
jgi:DNA-binding SARP family transcriptional activator